MMELPILEKNTRFSCASCGDCCNQPWRTVIEADKAAALDDHDFSSYPRLVGRRYYHPPADGQPGFFDLAKVEGTKCLFLDTDGLCIIHKELGEAAKPRMCRQFPFISSRTRVDHRISANFGCPSVQANRGRLLTEQVDDIAQVVSASDAASKFDATVPFNGRQTITLAECDAMLDQAMDVLGEHRAGNIWDRFTELLGLLAAYPRSLPGLANKQTEPAAAVAPFSQPMRAPLAARMLFAATLQPDTIPADTVGRMSLLGRLSTIPNLRALASLSGAYASRLLGRNVRIDEVLRHPVEPDLEPASTRLLLRYFRSRFWLRTLIGTRLSIVGGVHQHIHDLNVVLFFARAEAQNAGVCCLAEATIRRGLGLVELHLANQPRLYDQVLTGWLRRQLNDLGLAAQSLKLMALSPVKATNVNSAF